MNRIKNVVAIAVLSLMAGFLSKAVASVPSNGSTIQGRVVVKDGNGVPFMQNQDIGFKVFVATAAGRILVLNESGIAPTSGLVHQICVSSGAVTDWGGVYDSSATLSPLGDVTAANYATLVPLLVGPYINRVVASEHCSPFLDVQFNNGLVVLQSAIGATSANAVTHVYWRPSQGGGN